MKPKVRMAHFTIEKRATAAGVTRYRCAVVVKSGSVIIHRERKTFAKLALAKTWGKLRVAELEANGLPKTAEPQSDLTVGDLLDLYVSSPHISYSRSKAESLSLIRKCEIATIPLAQLTQGTYFEHCKVRSARGAGPATLWCDISFIGAILEAAKPMFNIDVDIDSYRNARYHMTKIRMIAPSGKRSRRPTKTETERLLIALKKREETAYSKAPFSEIFLFSILSCMRIGEVTRIRWDDIDETQKAVLVRDRKDPRKKEGNHMYVPLLGEAWDIVQRQPHIDELIFPFRAKSITQVFNQERKKLGIDDLRYHDLRREGVSRLFEAGFTIEEVAQVSGHRSLNTLWQVYTELFPKSLHDRYDELQQQKNR